MTALIFEYDPWLVLLSFLIAAVASFTALDLTKRVRSTDRSVARGWWIAGSMAMGTGIWAMHFVGMLAVALPIEFGYAYGTTLLSWIAAVCVSALALGLATAEQLSRPQLGCGALAMGCGICAMHYIGMMAMSMDPAIRWSTPWVALSAVIAVAASALALLIFFRLPNQRDDQGLWWQGGASFVLATGITGMHYAGMAAADIPSDSVCQSLDGLRGSGLYALIAGATIALLGLTLIVSAFDRYMTVHRQRLECEIDRRTAALKHALEVAEVANRAKTEFLAAISHELRTPLTSIRGFAELMEMSNQNPTTKMQASLIRKGAEHLNALLSEILDFSKIQAGAMQLHREPLNLRSLVQGTVDFFNLTAQEKNLALRWTVTSDCPEEFNCDSLRLKQILNNLLSNALKFTQAGGVEVQVRREKDHLLFEIEDTGPGIPEHLQEIIFEKFRQADERISHDHGGTGLGLALSRDLAHLMQGNLEVQSVVGTGSRFTLSLPIFESDAFSLDLPLVRNVIPG